jgi:hypothetical protein
LLVGFRFVLATRNQYELPVDAIPLENGLMVICDLPMMNLKNVEPEEGQVTPYVKFSSDVNSEDSMNRKVELKIIGKRQHCYFAVTPFSNIFANFLLIYYYYFFAFLAGRR